MINQVKKLHSYTLDNTALLNLTVLTERVCTVYVLCFIGIRGLS